MIFSEDVINIICDNLHYPELSNAYETLSPFDKKNLEKELDNAIEKSLDYERSLAEMDGEEYVTNGKAQAFKYILDILQDTKETTNVIELLKGELELL